jgi:hypothetical protein
VLEFGLGVTAGGGVTSVGTGFAATGGVTGLVAGFSSGFAAGFSSGFDTGFSSGFVAGVSDGCSSGFVGAFTAGFVGALGVGFVVTGWGIVTTGAGGGDTLMGKVAFVSATRSGSAFGTEAALNPRLGSITTINASANNPARFKTIPSSIKRRLTVRDMNHGVLTRSTRLSSTRLVRLGAEAFTIYS